MSNPLFVLAFATASLAQTLVATAKDQKDEDLIQGTWKVVKLEYDGEVNTKNFLGRNWVFNANELSIVETGKVIGKGTFVLDPDKDPKTIDIKGTDGRLKGKTILGIYMIETDTLKICQGIEQRPTEFSDAGKKGKPGLLTLERVKDE